MNKPRKPRAKREPAKPALTSNQRLLLRLLASHDQPVPPTQRELANAICRSVPYLRSILLSLRDRGLVAWSHHAARTLRITDAGRAAC